MFIQSFILFTLLSKRIYKENKKKEYNLDLNKSIYLS